MEKTQKILLWLMEGQKEMVQHKRSPYGSVRRDKDESQPPPPDPAENKVVTFCFRSTVGSKRAPDHDGPRLGFGEPSGSTHPCVGGQRSSVLPSHPFIQDPTMPPNPAPSPLIQLEEVRRRLEEEKIKSGNLQPKQR